MTVKVDRMIVIALIVEAETVAVVFADHDRIGFGELLPVDGPVVYPIVASKFAAKNQRNEFSLLRCRAGARICGRRAEYLVIPRRIARHYPTWRFSAIFVLHDDAQALISDLIVHF